MSSSLSWKEWLFIVVVNVLVSALTTWIVVRMLMNQPAAAGAEPSKAAAVAVALNPRPTAPSAIVATSRPAAIPTVAPNTAAPNTAAPVAAVPTAAPTPLPTLAAPTAAPAREAVGVRIASVTFPGQRQREFVALVNEGDTSSLQGWALQSSRGISFTLPNVTVFRDGFLNIYSTNGTNSPTEVFMGRNDAAWQAGDVISLVRDGQPVSRFEVK